MTVGLLMLVKDEEAVIGRCLDSFLPLIDSWVVCDTGSTDRTPEIAQERLSGLPGLFHRLNWAGFGLTWTEALRLARGSADYLVMPHADMTLVADGRLGELSENAYGISIIDDSSFTYRVPAIVKGDLVWGYEGATHEYLVGNDYPNVPAPPLDSWKLFHHADGARRPTKLNDDLALLSVEVEENPLDARSVFYLAQTYRDLGLYEQAAAMYERRVMLGGWEEEAWYALYQKGVCLIRCGKWWDGRMTLIQAWHRRPQRAEPLRALAMSILPPTDETLFVELDAYAP
jgi:glycosyltransferase involved in cell wall biosynthesis